MYYKKGVGLMRKFDPLYEHDRLIYWPYYQTITGCAYLLTFISITSLCLSVLLSFVSNCLWIIIVITLLGFIAFISMLLILRHPQRYTMIQITSAAVDVTNPNTEKNEHIVWENVIEIAHQIQTHYGLEWYIVKYISQAFPEGNERRQGVLRLPLYGVDKHKIKAFIPKNVRISRNT